MKRVLSLCLVLIFPYVLYSQTDNYFFGIPLHKDRYNTVKELKGKGFKVINQSYDSLSLKGTIGPFGKCNVVLFSKIKKIKFLDDTVPVKDILRNTYSFFEKNGLECYELSRNYMAIVAQDRINVDELMILDLSEVMSVKFKGVALGQPLKDIRLILEKEYDYYSTYKGYTILKGKFAGYRDCSIYLNAEKENEIVSVVSVYFPSEEKWENLLFQYDSLKRSLAEKYGEPQESIEKLGGCTDGSIEDLINGNLKFKTVFKSSIFGEIIISLLGYKESLSGAVYISYCDLLSLMIENKENKEDL